VVNNYKPAEVFSLEEMIERFLYIEDGDRVQDLRKPWDIVPMRQFVKSHKSSGKVTTDRWEYSERRKQARFPDFNLARGSMVGKYFLAGSTVGFIAQFSLENLLVHQYKDGRWDTEDIYLSLNAFVAHDPTIWDSCEDLVRYDGRLGTMHRILADLPIEAYSK
jgi:hypothetical protein